MAICLTLPCVFALSGCWFKSDEKHYIQDSDVEVEDGYAVVLENIVRVDENGNAEFVVFEFNVIDLSQTTKYPSVNDIIDGYEDGLFDGGYTASVNGDIDATSDWGNSPISLQSGNFIVVDVGLPKTNN